MIGIAPDNAETRIRNFGFNSGPDFSAKIFDAVNIWLPIHRADKGDQGRLIRVG